MTITEKDRALLLKYRTNQAYEAIKGAEIAIDHNQFTMAVNRIYYGMFYILSALALKYGYKTSKHQGLISWFNKTFIKENKIELKYGKIIRDASDSRRDGDYGDFIEFEKEEVLKSFSDMKDFIAIIDKFISEN